MSNVSVLDLPSHGSPMGADGRVLRWRPRREILLGIPLFLAGFGALLCSFGVWSYMGRFPSLVLLGLSVGPGIWSAQLGARLLVHQAKSSRWNATAPSILIGPDDVTLESAAGVERVSFAEARARDFMPRYEAHPLHQLLALRAACAEAKLGPEVRYVAESLRFGKDPQLDETLASDMPDEDAGPAPDLHIAIAPSPTGFSTVGAFWNAADYADAARMLPEHRVFVVPTSWDQANGGFVPATDPRRITELT